MRGNKSIISWEVKKTNERGNFEGARIVDVQEHLIVVLLKTFLFVSVTTTIVCVGVLNCRLVNLWIAHLGSDGELGERKDVYWFGQNVSTPVRDGLRYQLYILFAVEVTNDRERNKSPKSLLCVRRALKTALFV
jgi:hypothetical protein